MKPRDIGTKDGEEFLRELRDDLKARRFSPLPVRERMIPKTSGKLRRLWIPTARDRCVQASLKLVLEPIFEADFEPCSYGFRPMRRAQDAIEDIHHLGHLSHERILESDIASCFDEISHSALLDRVRGRIADGRVLSLVKAFLIAGILSEDGAVRGSKTGTRRAAYAQLGITHRCSYGSAISPLLANHVHALGVRCGMAWEFPTVAFERYCDDIIVQARSERQALHVRAMVASRLADCGLELNEQKTRIVYCKDDDRRGSYEHTLVDFLGYTFRPRLSKNRFGKHFLNFSPAVSNDGENRDATRCAAGGCTFARRRPSRTWRMFNIVLQGWINYYGRFYKSMLYPVFRHLNEILVRWAMRKYKRLRRRPTRARRFIADVARRPPDLFAHWRFGVRPDG